jgi:hypothetical protein
MATLDSPTDDKYELGAEARIEDAKTAGQTIDDKKARLTAALAIDPGVGNWSSAALQVSEGSCRHIHHD